MPSDFLYRFLTSFLPEVKLFESLCLNLMKLPCMDELNSDHPSFKQSFKKRIVE